MTLPKHNILRECTQFGVSNIKVGVIVDLFHKSSSTQTAPDIQHFLKYFFAGTPLLIDCLNGRPLLHLGLGPLPKALIGPLKITRQASGRDHVQLSPIAAAATYCSIVIGQLSVQVSLVQNRLCNLLLHWWAGDAAVSVGLDKPERQRADNGGSRAPPDGPRLCPSPLCPQKRHVKNFINFVRDKEFVTSYYAVVLLFFYGSTITK